MYASVETGTEVARRWLGTFLVTPGQVDAGPESGEILLELLSPLSKPPYGRVERQAAGSQVVLESVCNMGLVPQQFRLLVTVRRGSGTLLLQPFSRPKPGGRIRMTPP